MNITIFGANGTIGRIVTGLALANGDVVTAFVRRPDGKIKLHDNLIVLSGAYSDCLLIEKAIEKADVVISTMGPALDYSRKIKGSPIADAHKIIINSMEKLEKKRFITLATPTVKSNEDKKHLATIIPGIMAKILFPNGYMEMKKIEEMIKISSLDWTVVRIINPNIKHSKNDYDYSFGDRPAKMSVSKENAGSFIYKIAKENLFVKKMPIVYNK